MFVFLSLFCLLHGGWLWWQSASMHFGVVVAWVSAQIALFCHLQKPFHHHKTMFFFFSIFYIAMQTFVLSTSLLWKFIAWEWMGLCSFFLIASRWASAQAWAINQIAESAFLIATAGFLVYKKVFPWMAWLWFLAVAVKAAQVVFQRWLIDAMEGPAPVSALLHSATMVAAGAFFLIQYTPWFQSLLPVIQIVGFLSACIASLYALTTLHLKRLLAYSTIAHLGFLLWLAGIQALQAATYYLYSHAFFKAALFLVTHLIYQQHQTYDLEKLKKKLPLRSSLGILNLLLWCALMGLPFTLNYHAKTFLTLSTTQTFLFLIMQGLSCAYALRVLFQLHVWRPAPLSFDYSLLPIAFLTLTNLFPTFIFSLKTFIGLLFGVGLFLFPWKRLSLPTWNIWLPLWKTLKFIAVQGNKIEGWEQKCWNFLHACVVQKANYISQVEDFIFGNIERLTILATTLGSKMLRYWYTQPLSTLLRWTLLWLLIILGVLWMLWF